MFNVDIATKCYYLPSAAVYGCPFTVKTKNSIFFAVANGWIEVKLSKFLWLHFKLNSPLKSFHNFLAIFEIVQHFNLLIAQRIPVIQSSSQSMDEIFVIFSYNIENTDAQCGEQSSWNNQLVSLLHFLLFWWCLQGDGMTVWLCSWWDITDFDNTV